MVEVNPHKETLLLGILNVFLPTFDVYSDIGLTAKLYKSTVTLLPGRWLDGLSIYATILLIPFMINYALGWRAWYYGDVIKRKYSQRKKFTWIFALLGCYPQFVVGRIIWLFWTKPKRAEREKKHLERNVMQNEVYTEAVPTSIIMMFLLVAKINSNGNVELIVEKSVLGAVTFFSSWLSASLGLAKSLKVGLIIVIRCRG